MMDSGGVGDGGGIKFLTEQDSFERICDAAESKEYWVIITDSSKLLSKIGNTSYKPGMSSNADFELCLRPEMVSVAMAKKSRMSYKQLKY
jgi:hypothetical protein